MKTSIATVSLSGTLGEKLEAIAAAKFDAVEIFENDLISFNGTPADVRRACAACCIGDSAFDGSNRILRLQRNDSHTEEQGSSHNGMKAR